MVYGKYKITRAKNALMCLSYILSENEDNESCCLTDRVRSVVDSGLRGSLQARFDVR